MGQIHSYKNIVKVAIPLFIGYFGQNIVNITDTAFMGRVGEIELGAVGNAGLFYMLFVLIATGFTSGLQIIIGRRNGEKDYKTIGRLLQQGLYFALPLAGLFFVTLFFFSGHILSSFVQSEEILNTATKFLKIRSFGLFFSIVNLTFTAFFIGITKTRIISISSTIMSLANIGLDYALIFGKWGLPELGSEGAALASVISEFINTTILITYTMIAIDRSKYAIFRLVPINVKRLGSVLKLSYPMMFQNFLSFGSWFVFFSIIEHLGERELAISHIIRSVYMMIMMPIFSLRNTVSTIVSNLIGRNESNFVRLSISRATLLGLSTNLFLGGIIWLFPEAVLHIFTNDLNMITDSKGPLLVISFSMFFFTVASIQYTGVNGSGNTLHSLVIEFINIVIYIVVTYFAVFVYAASLEQVWCTEFVYFFSLGVMSYFYLKSDIWKAKKI